MAEPEAVVVPFLEWIQYRHARGQLGFPGGYALGDHDAGGGGVGTLIHIYAIGYMHSDVRHNGDPGRFRRFFVYLNLFIAAMMILVSADNYLMLFVGWEGVGLCSYLLIGFWFEKGAGGIAQCARPPRRPSSSTGSAILGCLDRPVPDVRGVWHV